MFSSSSLYLDNFTVLDNFTFCKSSVEKNFSDSHGYLVFIRAKYKSDSLINSSKLVYSCICIYTVFRYLLSCSWVSARLGGLG